METKKKYILIGLIILTVLIGSLVIYKKMLKSDVSDGPQRTEKTVPVAEQNANFKAKGPSSAPITIIEFSDFQCPSCKHAQEPLKELMDKFPGMIQLHFKHFPLPMHRFALLAAASVECAGTEGKFWEFHDLVFKEQDIWSKDADVPALFLAYANSTGLDRQKFESCVNSRITLTKVQADAEQARMMEVSSTPTFFINGERVVGSQQLKEKGPEIIRAKLEALVGKKQSS